MGRASDSRIRQWTLALLLTGGLSAVWLLSGSASPQNTTEARVRKALESGTGTVRLPPGKIEITSALVIPADAHDLKVVGDPAGTELHASESFRGVGVLIVQSGTRIELDNFTIDGNRSALEQPVGLPPVNTWFARHYQNNGIVAEKTAGLTISGLRLRNIANFAILVAQSSNVRISGVEVSDSGSRFSNGRNNTTGGILLEEGTTDFSVENSHFENVRGNGVWTHSWRGSLRNIKGRIAGNSFDTVARDAIQVGHAMNITVENNTGRRIGYPVPEVDAEGGGIPAALDTAGNVERSAYIGNHFEEVNGKCIDLDGFHHGEVTGNACRNSGSAETYPFGNYGIAMNNTDPEMRSEFITVRGNSIDGALYGGILVIGTHHVIENNRFVNLNLAHCADNQQLCSYRRDSEPDFLRSGIYLAARAERPDPARENRIQNNVISGDGMAQHCIVAAPGARREANQVKANRCSNSTPQR